MGPDALFRKRVDEVQKFGWCELLAISRVVPQPSRPSLQGPPILGNITK